MKTCAVDLERVVDKYLAGEQAFWEFYQTFMQLWVDAELVGTEADQWDEIYEAVYMSGPDPVDLEDRLDGIIGEAESRSQLSELRRRTT